MGGSWRVFVSWVGYTHPTFGVWTYPETCTEHPTWPTARRDAFHWACLAGVRYVSVQRPDDVVAGEYDAYTKRWRQYPRALVDVDHVTEVTAERGAMVAWCMCGWSAFQFHGPGPADADAAADRVRVRADGHVADPTRA